MSKKLFSLSARFRNHNKSLHLGGPARLPETERDHLRASGFTKSRLSADVSHAPHEATDQQIESWRAKLSFIVSVWTERHNLMLLICVPQYVSRGPIDGRPLPTLLVLKGPAIS
jgi:hypothetical protein